MNKSLALKNKLYLFFLLLISLFIFVYLFYFLINGDRGIIAYYKIKNVNYEYNKSLIELENQNLLLTDRINRLKINSIKIFAILNKSINLK